MNKIIVIEDNKEYRGRWAMFFSEYGPYLDVEVEIPDEIPNLPKLVASGIIEDAYFILDNNLAGFGSRVSGCDVSASLERLGIYNKTIMSSEEKLKSNVGKPSKDKELYILCEIASVLCGLNIEDADGDVHLLVRSEKEFHIFEVYFDTSEDTRKKIKAASMVMRAWFKKK